MEDYDDYQYNEFDIIQKMEVLMEFYDMFIGYSTDLEEKYIKSKELYIKDAKSKGMDEEATDRWIKEAMLTACGFEDPNDAIKDDCTYMAYESIKQFYHVAPNVAQEMEAIIKEAYWLVFYEDIK